MYWVTESSGTETRQGVKSGIWLSIQLRQLLEERRVWFLCVSVLLLWLFLMLNEWISRSYKHIVTLLVVLAVFVFLPGEFNYEQAIQLSQLLTGHNINTMYLVATNKKRCRHFINSVIIIIILLNTCNPLSLSLCSLQPRSFSACAVLPFRCVRKDKTINTSWMRDHSHLLRCCQDIDCKTEG